jgi:hypothetical protein
MELIGEEIVAFDAKDKMTCQKAYELSVDSKPILPVPYNDPLFLDRLSTNRVVSGLVKAGLRECDNSSYDLSREEALFRLVELFTIHEIARISLEYPDYTEHGLGQPEASEVIDLIYGDIESPNAFSA